MDALASDIYAKRRSRWERAEPSPIQITARDLDYLQLVFENGPTRANLIHALVAPGVSQAVTTRRLNRLYRAPRPLLERPAQQRESYNANYSFLVYDLSAAGEQLLAERGRISEEDRAWRASLRRSRYLNFWHDVLLGEILGSVRLGVRGNPALRFISWPDILRKAPHTTRAAKAPFTMRFPMQSPAFKRELEARVTPDAVFGLEYIKDGKSSYRFFAVEADRATEPIRRSDLYGSSYHKKIEQYRELVKREVHRSHLGVPNLLVLTVTTSERHRDNLVAFVEERHGASKLLLFKHAVESLEQSLPPTGHILTTPWLRPGCDPFDIGKP